MSRITLVQRCYLVTVLTTFLSILFLSVCARPAFAQDEFNSETTYRSSERPDLAIAYDKVARFKLATRKKEYRVGETIGLEFAMLNVSDVPLFLLRPDWPDFSFKVGTGPEQHLPFFLLVDGAVLADSFNLVKPGSIVTGSTLLLAGCPVVRASLPGDRPEATVEFSERRIFELGDFGNVEQGCIPFSTPGEYTIFADFGNADVVLDLENLGAMTAVGKIRSEPLTIRIGK